MFHLESTPIATTFQKEVTYNYICFNSSNCCDHLSKKGNLQLDYLDTYNSHRCDHLSKKGNLQPISSKSIQLWSYTSFYILYFDRFNSSNYVIEHVLKTYYNIRELNYWTSHCPKYFLIQITWCKYTTFFYYYDNLLKYFFLIFLLAFLSASSVCPHLVHLNSD